MRFIVLLSAILIAGAIREGALTGSSQLLATILLIALAFDVAEFFTTKVKVVLPKKDDEQK